MMLHQIVSSISNLEQKAKNDSAEKLAFKNTNDISLKTQNFDLKFLI
jgi:hypothetical protein